LKNFQLNHTYNYRAHVGRYKNRSLMKRL